MKLSHILNEAQSFYYRVIDGFDAWLAKPSGHGFPTHTKFHVEPGDEIHWLPGGFFIVRDGKARETLTFKRPEDMTQGEYHMSTTNKRLEQLEKLERAGSIERIDRPSAPVQYR